jgi:Ca-activated chloride channel family protein
MTIWIGRHLPLAIIAATALALGFASLVTGWDLLWATPDQRGTWDLREGRNKAAADAFLDPIWRGIALMRGGAFTQAADSFAQANTAEAIYDRGNALIMLGDYADAIAQYDKALALRPGWPDAAANRHLAALRQALANPAGESEETMLAPLDEAYDANRNRNEMPPPNEDAETGMSNTATRALWLRRVQTTPGDFLRARFAYQLEHNATDAAP